MRARRLAGLLALTFAFALLLAPGASALEAHTVTFTPSDEGGFPQGFEIPAGVTQIEVTAIGGAGRVAQNCGTAKEGAGGAGAKVTAKIPVTAGSKLYVAFGGGGAGGYYEENGGRFCFAGSGGGASDVRSEKENLSSRLIVAGGGGGGGVGHVENSADSGGAGGNAEGETGEAGHSGISSAGPQGGGGEGGSQAAGGKGPGGAGGAGTGGEGAPAGGAGGGGGSGYYGGAGGGGGGYDGGGGGAGSSFLGPITEGGRFASGAGEPQEVVFKYVGGPAVRAPEATIEKPADHAYVALGSHVATRFSCKEGENGPGIASCTDSNGTRAPEGSLNTSESGEHEYKVTALSKSGNSQTAVIHYKVAKPPQAFIDSPPSGGYYGQGQHVPTTFHCEEGAKPLESCKDSRGSSGGAGELDTSTPGVHEYSVTAKSTDGLEATTTIHYRVLPGRTVVVFSEAGKCSEWNVPEGVSKLHVYAIGQGGEAPAALGLDFRSRGGEVQGSVAVKPGQALEGCVGVLGGRGGANAFGSSGFNGGGLSGIAPAKSAFSTALLVAGGGGGAAAFEEEEPEPGRGGNAGEAGENGKACCGQKPAPGGTVGGNGGLAAGGAGAPGGNNAINSVGSAGGGGGAGFPGGGGGGAAYLSSGAGGAGGADYCAEGCELNALAPLGTAPLVVIAYTVAPQPTTLKTELSGEGKNGASITVKEGAEVKDQATLAGQNAAKASGEVAYKVYSDKECKSLVAEAGSGKAGEGRLPPSSSEKLAPGTYYWQAEYKGDEDNEASKSECGSEVETVTPVAKPTALSTTLEGEGKSAANLTVKEGAEVKDRATLSGEHTAKASGEVAYKVYSDKECKSLVAEAGSGKASEGKLPASSAEKLVPGTYYWQAEYKGDEYNEASKSECGSEVLTVKAKPATCGKTTLGKGSDALTANQKRVNRCQIPYSALVSELTVYLQPTKAKGTQLIKGILYEDAIGKPGKLIATTAQLSFTSKSPAGWYRLAFSPTVKVSAGSYWIGIITGNASLVAGERYDGVRNAEDYNANSYASGPSKSFGSFSTTSEEMSLYATFAREVT